MMLPLFCAADSQVPLRQPDTVANIMRQTAAHPQDLDFEARPIGAAFTANDDPRGNPRPTLVSINPFYELNPSYSVAYFHCELLCYRRSS